MRLRTALIGSACCVALVLAIGCSGRVSRNPSEPSRGSGGLPTQLNSDSAAPSAEYDAAKSASGSVSGRDGGDVVGPRTVNSPQDLEHFALDRYQIKDATVVLEVEDVADALDRVLEDIRQARGYVLSSEEALTVDRAPKASMAIRVPSSEFEGMLGSLGRLGTVLQRKVTSADVTEEYIDLESDLASKRVIEERVDGYLRKASNLEEMRKLQAELDAIRADINRVQGRLQFLQTRTAFSTIQLTIQPAAIAAPPVPTPSYSFQKVTNDALRDQIAWIQAESDGLVRNAVWVLFRVPYLLFWGLLFWGAARLWRFAIAPRMSGMRAALDRPVL